MQTIGLARTRLFQKGWTFCHWHDRNEKNISKTITGKTFESGFFKRENLYFFIFPRLSFLFLETIIDRVGWDASSRWDPFNVTWCRSRGRGQDLLWSAEGSSCLCPWDHLIRVRHFGASGFPVTSSQLVRPWKMKKLIILESREFQV